MSLLCCRWSCHFDELVASVNGVLVKNTGNNTHPPILSHHNSSANFCNSAAFGNLPSSKHRGMLSSPTNWNKLSCRSFKKFHQKNKREVRKITKSIHPSIIQRFRYNKNKTRNDISHYRWVTEIQQNWDKALHVPNKGRKEEKWAYLISFEAETRRDLIPPSFHVWENHSAFNLRIKQCNWLVGWHCA